jgi:DUF4097 and DUF4098 domain-containing protein YvlB
MRIEFRDIASKRLLPAALVATLALAASNVMADDDTSINKRAPADPAGEVQISNTSGSVVVTGWNRNEVEVTGELGDDAEKLEFVTSGKLTRIKVVLPRKSHGGDDSDLVVRVPSGSSLSVNTVSADIQVQGVRGAQRLQSVSADIETAAAGEDVESKTVSGDISVTGHGAAGVVTITTVSGDAQVQNVAGEVNGNTVSGNFEFDLGQTTRSRLRSTSGDLTLKGRLTSDARFDAESISGDIRLDVVGKPSGEFDVSSFNGEIRNCFGPKPERTDEYAPGRELRFREGTGNARIRIKTLNGDISVCSK